MSALRSFRATTLITAWMWSCFALITWATTWTADRLAQVLSIATADHAWYACAVFSLCPPIAVLGSRRPGTRVWTWFILLPMLLVLGWPVGSLWLQGTELRGLQLETPQLAAFTLVLIMGVGNYFGTRHTLSALLYNASVLGIVVSFSVIAPNWLRDRAAIRLWSSILMILAILLTRRFDRPKPKNPLDLIWFDFFDSFGIVWGRRIQDRVNYQLQKESLPVRLELDGFRWTDQPPSNVKSTRVPESTGKTASETDSLNVQVRRDTEARIEQILRWLLRRFVDPAWINQRLDSKSLSVVAQLPVDS